MAQAGLAPSRPTRSAWSLKRAIASAGAGVAALGFIAAYIVPTATANAEPQDEVTSSYAASVADAQIFTAPAELSNANALSITDYEIYVTPTPTPEPEPVVAAASTGGGGGGGVSIPSFVAPSPGTAQDIAYGMVAARGWGDSEFSCLVALWNKESGWRVNAYNPYSGAYGIPQSLPGSKMASVGADWQTNPATQITWGLNYIQGRYGSPCGAWGHSQSVGWY